MKTKHDTANCFGWEDGCSFCIEERKKGTGNVSNLHTAGPWELWPEYDHEKIGRYQNVASGPVEQGGQFIAAVLVGTDELKANARLIAAAPEILYAAKVALGALHENSELSAERAIELLTRAIAKAEGK